MLLLLLLFKPACDCSKRPFGVLGVVDEVSDGDAVGCGADLHAQHTMHGCPTKAVIEQRLLSNRLT